MGRRTRRGDFEITEERMFWEIDAELAPFAAASKSSATVAPPVAPPAISIAERPAPEPSPPAATQPSALNPDSPVGSPGPVNATAPVSGVHKLSDALPPWALEAEWTSPPTPARRRTLTPATLAAAGALSSAVLAVAVLGLSPGSREATPASRLHPSLGSVSSAGRRMPIALTGYLSSTPHFVRAAGPSEHRPAHRAYPSHPAARTGGRKPARGRVTPRHKVAADRVHKSQPRRDPPSAAPTPTTATTAAVSSSAAAAPVPAHVAPAPAVPVERQPAPAAPAVRQPAPPVAPQSSEFQFEQ